MSADALFRRDGEGATGDASAAGWSVRLVCWLCANRYASAVDADCPLCRGDGVVAAPVPVGIRPIVAARAASMLGLEPEGDYEARRQAGRLEADSGRARGVVGTLNDAQKAVIGRSARALSLGKPLPPAAWVKVTPADRRRVVAEIAAIRLRSRVRGRGDAGGHRRPLKG